MSNTAEPSRLEFADGKRHAPTALRNREAILQVLREVLPAAGAVLEIASGTGEHAVHFAAALPHLVWQPSEPDPGCLVSIAAWSADAELPNLRPPLALDVRQLRWPVPPRAWDAVVCINMIHIAPWETCRALLAGAAIVLQPGAPLLLYGPFMREGRHTAPSNAAFDAQLRAVNPAHGVRDVGAVTAEAMRNRLLPDRVLAMPANNLVLVFRRDAGDPPGAGLARSR